MLPTAGVLIGTSSLSILISLCLFNEKDLKGPVCLFYNICLCSLSKPLFGSLLFLCTKETSELNPAIESVYCTKV